MHQPCATQHLLQQQVQRYSMPQLPVVKQPYAAQQRQLRPLQPLQALPHAAASHSSCHCTCSHFSTGPCQGYQSWASSNKQQCRPRSSVAAKAAGTTGGRGPAWRPPKPQPQPQAPPAPSPPPIIDPNSIDSEGLAGMFMSYAKQLQEAMQQKQAAGPVPGANVVAKGLGFHPPGAEHPLLADVSFHLKPNQLGLIIGRSGSGKTTLLQLLAGLSEQTSGDIFIHRPTAGDHSSGLFLPTHIEQRMQQVRWVLLFVPLFQTLCVIDGRMLHSSVPCTAGNGSENRG